MVKVGQGVELEVLDWLRGRNGSDPQPASIRKIRSAGIVLRPLAGNPQTQLLVSWSPRESSPVLREFLEVVRRYGEQASR